MRLYDGVIQELARLFAGRPYQSYPYDSQRAWRETEHYEVILRKNLELELGVAGGSANLTCATTGEQFFEGDEIRVYGPELDQIQGKGPYGRVVEVLLQEDESLEEVGGAYKLLQDLDFLKYKLYPAGFMMRISPQSYAEEVRVSREALRQGISFEALGNLFISRYHKIPLVRQVRVSFLTDPGMNYSQLGKLAREGGEIRLSLNRFSEGLSTQCSLCSIQELCAKIEGLRELHFGALERAREGGRRRE